MLVVYFLIFFVFYFLSLSRFIIFSLFLFFPLPLSVLSFLPFPFYDSSVWKLKMLIFVWRLQIQTIYDGELDDFAFIREWLPVSFFLHVQFLLSCTLFLSDTHRGHNFSNWKIISISTLFGILDNTMVPNMTSGQIYPEFLSEWGEIGEWVEKFITTRNNARISRDPSHLVFPNGHPFLMSRRNNFGDHMGTSGSTWLLFTWKLYEPTFEIWKKKKINL